MQNICFLPFFLKMREKYTKFIYTCFEGGVFTFQFLNDKIFNNVEKKIVVKVVSTGEIIEKTAQILKTLFFVFEAKVEVKIKPDNQLHNMPTLHQEEGPSPFVGIKKCQKVRSRVKLS